MYDSQIVNLYRHYTAAYLKAAQFLYGMCKLRLSDWPRIVTWQVTANDNP